MHNKRNFSAFKHTPATGPTSPFSLLPGFLTGKKKERETDAKTRREAQAAEDAREFAKIEQDNLLLKIEAMKLGFNPDVEAANIDIAKAEAEAGIVNSTAKAGVIGETQLYILVGVVVTIVMFSVVLLRKK